MCTNQICFIAVSGFKNERSTLWCGLSVPKFAAEISCRCAMPDYPRGTWGTCLRAPRLGGPRACWMHLWKKWGREEDRKKNEKRGKKEKKKRKKRKREKKRERKRIKKKKEVQDQLTSSYTRNKSFAGSSLPADKSVTNGPTDQPMDGHTLLQCCGSRLKNIKKWDGWESKC